MNIVGPSYAKEIFFTGQRFNAAEAEMMGLVNRVVPTSELESTVISYARTIADNAPLTVKAAKAAVNEGTKNPGERDCLLYTSPSPRDATLSRMPSSA